MRSITHKDFAVDVGRKQMYSRLTKVDKFWRELLGSDYRPYQHRGGFLYEGRILEMFPTFRGFRRGMTWGLFLACVRDFAWSRINVFAPRPRNVEEYFYRSRGRMLTRVASQGFQEKLTGKRWADVPLPENFNDGGRTGFLTTVHQAFLRAFFAREEKEHTKEGVWYHPAKGTGQVMDMLAQKAAEAGAIFHYGAKVLNVKASEHKVESVTAEVDGETISFECKNLVSSIPLDILVRLLGLPIPEAYAKAATPTSRRTVILVYLFLNRPPKFPHPYLIVTCPKTRIGRITNYSGFNGDMVPPGKGCLCCEYYCFGDDPLLDVEPKELVRQTVEYCASSGLISRDSFVEEKYFKFPGADASQNSRNWINSMRLGLLDAVQPFQNLYQVARTDLDIATLAGIESIEAVLSGDRSEFDSHFDPANLGIGATSKKPFGFKMPPGVEV